MAKVLYHFTSYTHMLEIIASGKIKRSPSNLLRPDDLHFENGVAKSATDSYKPVVWLTSRPTPDKIGVYFDPLPPEYDKRRVRMEIDVTMLNAQKWESWADRNGMNPEWKAALTDGMDYGTWYVIEHDIPLQAVSRILDLFDRKEIRYK